MKIVSSETRTEEAKSVDGVMTLRMAQMDVRDKLIDGLREVHSTKAWKSAGYKSFQEFCERGLSYDRKELRDILMLLGLILTTDQLKADDPAVQARIDALKGWRRKRSEMEAVAAYRVFSNRTLLEIAKTNPKALADFKSISGLGLKRVFDYGGAILEVLARI